MARNSVNFTELEQLQKRFEELNNAEIERFNEELVKEKAKYFLGSVVRLTPVGQYDDGRVGGTLRRGWTTRNQREAELSAAFVGGRSIDAHINQNLKISKTGKTYSIEVANNVEYASYVNYGHRTRGNGFVNGQFFLEKALAETGTRSSKILDRKVYRLIRGAIDGN